MTLLLRRNGQLQPAYRDRRSAHSTRRDPNAFIDFNYPALPPPSFMARDLAARLVGQAGWWRSPQVGGDAAARRASSGRPIRCVLADAQMISAHQGGHYAHDSFAARC